MKTSITYLGMALLVLASAQAATKFTTEKIKNTATSIVAEIEQGVALESDAIASEVKNLAPVEDQTILNPETVLNVRFQKTIEEVIVADNQIIESDATIATSPVNVERSIETIIQENNQIIESENTDEIHPLYIERTIEDAIAEDNAIIESTISLAAQPLDFDAINKKSSFQKQNNIKLADRIQL